jgi:hypothetical protein
VVPAAAGLSTTAPIRGGGRRDDADEGRGTTPIGGKLRQDLVAQRALAQKSSFPLMAGDPGRGMGSQSSPSTCALAAGAAQHLHPSGRNRLAPAHSQLETHTSS